MGILSKHLYRNRDLQRHPAWQKMRGDRPPDWYVSNGATRAPDRLGAVDFRPAAHYHDKRYEEGGTEEDRYWADVEFLANCIECCRVAGAFFWRAKLYYWYVRLFGLWAFCYAKGHEPRSKWLLFVSLIFGRYVQW